MRRGEFSIVIPIRVRTPSLKRLLDSLLRQSAEFPAVALSVFVVSQFEMDTVLVRDGTIESSTTTSIDSPMPSPSINRNRGLDMADTEWIVFLDDDVVLGSGWFSGMMQFVSSPPAADLIGGQVTSINRRNWFSQAAEDFVVRHKEYPQGWFLVSAHLIARSDSLRSLGGFDPRFTGAGGEDWDLCLRALSQGVQTDITDLVAVEHENPTTWRELARRARSYGDADQPRNSEKFEEHSNILGKQNSVLPIRILTWIPRQYREFRANLGRSRLRAARSTAIYIPWMTTYLLHQKRRSHQRSSRSS